MSAVTEKQSSADVLKRRLVEAEVEIDTLQRKTAEYIEATQPALDRHTKFAAAFEKRATQVVGVLMDRGIVDRGTSDTLVEKLAEDPVRALDLVARLARMVGPDSLGKAAQDVSTSTGRRLDGFEALVLTGDPMNTNPTSPLTVE